jgi:hypothetical protein
MLQHQPQEENLMARKKAGQPHDGQDPKISLILSQELHDQVDQACARHRLSRSALVRKLVEGSIGEWLEPRGTSAALLQQQPGAATAVQVTQEVAQALEAVGRYTGLDRHGVAQLVLAEHLGEFGERARRRHEELLRLPAPPTRGEDEPGPA